MQSVPTPLPDVKKMDDVWPIGKKSAWFTCSIAFLLGMFDLLDRMIIAALFPYIKAEYALSDTQLGALSSVLTLAVALLVVPSAYFVDRWSRKKMMCLMGVIWSLATGACALAGTYAHLLVARFVCGAGEAGYNSASQSLLAASFPRRLRTTAIGLAQFGMFFGSVVGVPLGAYIATHWGWRHAFGVVAVPGLVISLLALRIKDFKTAPAATGKEKRPPYHAVLGTLLRTPTLVCVFLGAAFYLIHGGMLALWLPTYLNRMGNLSLTAAGGIFALNSIVNMVGLLASGPLVDWLRIRKSNAAPLWLSVAMLAAGLLNIWSFGFLRPGSVAQIGVILLAGLFLGSVATVGSSIVVDLSRPMDRATAVSLLILTQNLFGFSVGPLLAGALSDHFDLGAAIMLVSGALLVAAGLYAVDAHTHNRDRAKVSEEGIAF